MEVAYRDAEYNFATDVLRADHLRGPYYGLRPVPAAISTTLLRTGEDPMLVHSLACCDHLDQETRLSVHALLNSDTVINRIPSELLGEFFMFAHTSHPSSGAATWTPLLLVCRCWFVVAATTPRLWCSLSVSSACTDFLRTGLARSKDCPISVTVNALATDTPLETMDLLEPHLHRLQSYTTGGLRVEDEARLAAYLQNHKMPILESLSPMMFKPGGGSVRLLELNPELFPRLASLSLYFVQISPSSPILEQLTHLHLFGGLGPNFSSYHLAQMLRGCLNLETLKIEQLLVSDRDVLHHAVATVADRVMLTNLTYAFVESEAVVLHRILETIIAPPTACIVLRQLYPSDVQPAELEGGIRVAIPQDRSSVPILRHVTCAMALLTSSVILGAVVDS
ncbi:hypothetical protein C8Q80DRAFT_251910 [Daedaleopsis nitida]|nr:hypothetical protein C8Q80DRAFT_251910 [Daedaleopsis nitida]